MATFKACVQKERKDGFYPVYIRVTHHRGVSSFRSMIFFVFIRKKSNGNERLLTLPSFRGWKQILFFKGIRLLLI